MLGLGVFASEEFKLEFNDGFFSGIANRVIDLYFSVSASFGWLNELKIGKQYGTWSKPLALSQIFRDRVILHFPQDVCHPWDNQWGHKPCFRMPINGDTWWFRYKWGSTCQMSLLAIATGNLCPDSTLRNDLLDGEPRINVVYVFYDKNRGDELYYRQIYRKHDSAIRNALESNTCPLRALR
jgi:hypothetical protein